jgi:hypothetical protein
MMKNVSLAIQDSNLSHPNGLLHIAKQPVRRYAWRQQQQHDLDLDLLFTSKLIAPRSSTPLGF